MSEFQVGQKVSVKIPHPTMKYYVEHEAVIKEYDGRTWRQQEDWYTVILDNDEITRVRGVNIKE